MIRIKRLTAMLCAAVLLFSLMPAAMAVDTSPAKSSNAGGIYGKYNSNYANPIRSYLYQDEQELVRVEYIGDKVVVERYDAAFCIQSSFELPMELPLWGGFYAGENYNFLMFGQNNPEEDNNLEVIRVVKYDKEWNRLGQASLKGANTTIPFRAGSASFAEYNGMLYVRTCHQMYKSSDGLNHQSNLTFSVRQSDMKITDSFYAVANIGAGYVSHSFNQFILVDEQGKLAAMDHGDAHPRSLVLSRYKAKAGSDTFVNTPGSTYWYACERVELNSIPGDIGANTTGVQVTGFAETSKGYLTAYSDTGMGAASSSAYKSEVYLALVDKNQFSAGGISTHKVITDSYAAQPKLVPTSKDGGYVLWQTAKLNDNWYSYCNNVIQYTTYNADGTTGEVKTAEAELSNCQPIFYNGRVVWYTTNNSVPTFYTLDGSGVKAHVAVAGDRTEGSFVDVPANSWYANYVNKAAAAGLVQGVGNQRYEPDGKLTLAEAITLASRLYAQSNGETIPAASGEWYMDAYNYCISNGIITADKYPVAAMNNPATRFQMVDILDRALEDGQKAAIKDVSAVPDVAESDPYGAVVYSWYRAGIVEGDEHGNFNGSSDISRAEVAAILCRLAGLTPRTR